MGYYRVDCTGLGVVGDVSANSSLAVPEERTSQDVQKQDMLRQVKTILGWLPVLLSTMPFPLMHIWPS